ncbi:phage protein [Streptococcus gallolyticus]|uniref:Phage protein n=1 Tax=Streptococcus gallolyticus TaxID=315405 RepID=A0AA94M4Z2_9STRE|nr:hypothetical protein [Streptococcus gallolyticus]AQP43386.1 putative phage protein [Streptococcus gallolyticus subsp. gallolyticus DSM 16831]SQG80684.1 phage protein [Streptococcus gallolyticus]
MTLSKNEKELLRRLGLGKENAKTTKEIINGLPITERGARDILRRLAIRYSISITGLRNRDVNGVFIATTQAELLEGLTSLINQISEEQNRVTALANSNPEKSRELVKKLLEGV